MADTPGKVRKGSREAIDNLIADISAIEGDADVWYSTHTRCLGKAAIKKFNFSDDFVEAAQLVTKGQVTADEAQIAEIMLETGQATNMSQELAKAVFQAALSQVQASRSSVAA